MHVEQVSGSAADLHARALPPRATMWHFSVTRPAVVLGSTQRDDVVDHELAAARGVDVARRRSGGGAVWLAPGGTLWVDVVLPRDDPRWDDDVSRSALWLGEAWSQVIRDVTGASAEVHRGAMVCTALSTKACFAGVGPGEVSIGHRKVAGISQRRTRAAARFQCVAYERWDPAPLAELLHLPADAAAALADAAVGLGPVLTEIAGRLPAALR